MMAAIATGTSRLKNYSTSADCAATLSCLENLGVKIERTEDEVVIHGAGPRGLRAPAADLDCGNSGTTMRLLSGILAGQTFVSRLTGDESLRSRPMQRIIEPLKMMGADITSHDGRAPLRIQGSRRLQAIDYELLSASAQVKSCILLAGLNATGKTSVVEHIRTRDHTERMLPWFGAQVVSGKPQDETENTHMTAVIGPASLTAGDVSVPGDISSAAYFIAIAALLKGSSLQMQDVGLNPTRTEFMKVIAAMNFTEITQTREAANEASGNIRVLGINDLPLMPESDSALLIDGLDTAQMIDELPLLAVAGSQLAHGIEIRNAKELRVKESDRIAATVEGLRALGCEVEEFDDGLRVSGPAKLRGAKINSHGDHRIAMSFTVAAMIAEGETEISGADCVGVSFPEFFDLLESVIER
jgi:3-phosphoshikimate 1-carboxyvinyltransferase